MVGWYDHRTAGALAAAAADCTAAGSVHAMQVGSTTVAQTSAGGFMWWVIGFVRGSTAAAMDAAAAACTVASGVRAVRIASSVKIAAFGKDLFFFAWFCVWLRCSTVC